MSRGVLYIASTEEYLQEAEISASFLKKSNPDLNCSIVTPHRTRFDFDHVVEMKRPDCNRSAKIRNLPNSPYDETLFLDTDTLVLESIESGFELLKKYAFGFCIDPTGSGPIEEVPQSFPEVNTGVLFYQNDKKFRDFCHEWLAEFVSKGKYERFRDQPFFRKILWDRGCKFTILRPEWNLMVDLPAIAHGNVKIAHTRTLRSIDEHRYVDILNNIDTLKSSDNYRMFRPRVGNTIDCVYVRPSINSNSLERLNFHLTHNGVIYTIKRVFDRFISSFR